MEEIWKETKIQGESHKSQTEDDMPFFLEYFDKCARSF